MKILYALASYLLGSIPTGYLVFRLAGGRDIREYGSQSTGATNVLRVKGVKYALPVAVFDVLKGFLPVFLAMRLLHDPVLAAVSGFLAAVGHCFPFAIGFRGGKGMATAVGAFAALSLRPCLASLGLFLLVIAVTRFVSLGSILAVLAFPVFLVLFGGAPTAALVCALALAALVVFQHRGNIRRLLAGTERRIGERVA